MFDLCRVASEEDEANGTKNYEKVIERVGRGKAEVSVHLKVLRL